MKTKPKKLIAFSEKDAKTNKWCYIIKNDNINNEGELFRTDYIYNTETEANQAIQTDGMFDKFLQA